MITFAQCDAVIIAASLAGHDRLNSMKIDADASLWRTNVPIPAPPGPEGLRQRPL
jgi:hypothetical protein